MIQKYQTIDAIYAHIDEISGDVKQKLLDGKEDAAQSRGLIELKHIPEIQSTTLDTFALKFDFATYKDILVHAHHFTSFEKILDELKKQLQMPIQN